MAVVGAASTTADALTVARGLLPNVVIVDIFLGSESGFDLARELMRDGMGEPTVIFVSTHAAADFVDLIEASRAAGFVPKAELSAEAIRRLAG
jgi:DNA-binding NarL/FixJ family response regulator